MTAPDCAQVRDEIQRLADEIAFLTRSRDEWRDLQQRAMASAEEATMELQRVRSDRDLWRERALQAEAQLAGGAK